MTQRLRQPAPQAVCAVLLELLDTAAQAASRLDKVDDADALHDFRVALRRLRANLRAYRESLHFAAGDSGKRARRLARSTNVARDREVQLDWLRRQRRSAKSGARRELDALIGQWQAEHAAEQSQLRARTQADFAVLDAELRRDLRRPAARGHGNADLFAHVAARQLRRHGKKLARCLAAIEAQDDDAAAHAARIAGKRLRYLLESLVGELRGAARLIKRLKALQDLLGDLHDCEVLLDDLRGMAKSDATPELMRRAAARRARLYARLHREFTDEDAGELVNEVGRVANKLETLL